MRRIRGDVLFPFLPCPTLEFACFARPHPGNGPRRALPPAPANRGPTFSEAGPGRKKTAAFAAKTVAFLLINGARAESRVALLKSTRKEIDAGQRSRAWGQHKRFLLFLVLRLFLTGSRGARGPLIRVEKPGWRAWSYLIRGGFRPNSRAALRSEGTDPD